MKIIHKANSVHWACGITLSCPQCNSRFQLETEHDFEYYQDNINRIIITCPVCSHEWSYYRDNWKSLTDFDRTFDDIFTKFDSMFEPVSWGVKTGRFKSSTKTK